MVEDTDDTNEDDSEQRGELVEEQLIDTEILPHPFAQAANHESTEARNNNSNNSNNMKNNAPAYVQGLGDSEARAVEKFSFGKMIKEAAQGKLSGLEAEMNQEARNEFQDAQVNIAGGVSIPSMILRAAPMSVGADVGNGSSVGDRASWDGTVGIQDAGLIEAFRPNDVAVQMGVRQLTGLTGDVVFNVQASELAAEQANEAAALTEDNINFGAVKLQPKRYGVYTRVTDQMLAQSADDMGLFIANDIRKALDAKFSADVIAAINTAAGTLLEGTADANTVLDLEAELLAADVPLENIALLSGTTAYRYAREQSLDPGSGLLYATSPRDRRSIAGYPAIIHSGVVADVLYACDRSQLVSGTWGGLNIIVDPYTDADQGVVRMIANVYKDFKTLQASGIHGLDNVGATA
jgi:hypothetical protein